MNFFKNTYVNLILVHIAIGFVIFLMPSLAKIYGLLVMFFGFIYVFIKKNKNNEVLMVASYIVGSEALLRMTEGTISYEASKYGVMIFMVIGMYYSGFSKNALPYWIYILLLLPGIILATETLNLTTNIRTTIAFNISGPICLGVTSIYAYQRKVTNETLNTIFLYCGLPIISTIVYIVLYTPDLKEVLINTGSNFDTSGGFGPNQVSTILGLGMFIFFSRFILTSKTKVHFIVNVIIFSFILYRGLITFSRGGIITGMVMILILIFIIYINSKSNAKFKINFMIIFLTLLLTAVWIFTSNVTNGLIDKRYANQDVKGREKENQFSGREEIFNSEMDLFLENPIFGVGVAKGMEDRLDKTGLTVASHNELSRTIAEHGALGIIALLIVFFTPIILYLDNKQNIYVFCCILFWLLTINHAAMRIAAPAFIYSLALLKVSINEKTALHR
jgi:hypothetical protein